MYRPGKKYPKITQIVKDAASHAGYGGTELARETGISYATLMQQRYNNPAGFNLLELYQIYKVTHFTPEEWLKIYEVFERGDIRA